MRRIQRRDAGSVMLEFALVAIIVTPIILGMVMAGINLGRSIEATQIARDVGHMYALGVDFNNPNNRQIAARLAIGSNMTPSGGNGVVILSKIIRIYPEDCVGLPTSECTNQNQNVVTHRVTVGNASLRSSNYGSPSPLETNGTVRDFKKNGTAASSFNEMTLARGQVVYVAEAVINFGDTGFGGGTPSVYARVLF